MTGHALEVIGVSKSFGALQVSKNLSLSLERGARHAIIGPNGAGKTTFVHLVSGLLRPTKGTIRLDGHDVTAASPERRVAHGLVRTFQISSLFPKLTVAQHVGLALSARYGYDAKPWGELSDRTELMNEAAQILDSVGLLKHAATRVASMAYGLRRLIEVAIALALRPKVLLLDEPAAGLPSGDRAALLELLLRLPRDMAVLVIEHDMSLVFRFAERISVLVEGAILLEGTPADVRSDPRVRTVYLGTRAHG
ncbi:MAG TPA: ABC transporter ATP-binding protein [Burkholderiales bacterium]|nr:ABC transporter ATP-binding protein [Burkholderiales bacterium]